MSFYDLHLELKVLDKRINDWNLGYKSKDAAGIDLFACIDEPIVMYPQAAPILIGTGIAVHIKFPYAMALQAPRSSFGVKGLVLANTVGIIDADYQGEIRMAAWNRNPIRFDLMNPIGDGIKISPGDRIAQLIFMPILRANFHVVEEFTAATERGTGGLGSTGVAAG